jgi:nickel/cobalt exporter
MALFLRMVMVMFRHNATVGPPRLAVKNPFRDMGYGGICYPHCMPDFLQALQNGSHSLWLFIPTAIFLGALHGLEPGHSKTMMAAFIIAIRGTIWQAVLLGLSAALSHSLLIWILAAVALHYGSKWDAETVEPYLQIFSAVCILALAAWMYFRTRRELQAAHAHQHGKDGHTHQHGVHSHSHGAHDHEHTHDTHSHDDEDGHGHHHHEHDERVLVSLGHGTAVEVSIFETGCPPVFRVAATGSQKLSPSEITIETVRSTGAKQTFTFAAKKGFLESTTPIPEPHEFDAVLTFTHDGHGHPARIQFREGEAPKIAAEDGEFEDAHERAHAEDIARRFTGRTITTSQIVLFGITGGLMPCPAAFTVLLVCLQLKRAVLGFALVGAFSFGLALTMVATGALAAISVRHAQKRFRGFGEAMRRAPYVSCVLLVFLATYMAWQGWHGLTGHHH